ncbi:MAG: hypothetical protein AUK48_07825 [Oscillatoriales cyanobacterium CG2_30_44_21]|nr:MAG: hypothetical protein AUK48_07825 [Oscillatoriales cyanobacterium CG2_30_44_21]
MFRSRSERNIFWISSASLILGYIYLFALSTGQKFNGVKECFRISVKIEDDMPKEIKTKAKNTFR